MPWWIWLIPAAGILLYLFRLLSKPEYHSHISFDRLSQFVEQLIGRNKVGSVMLLERDREWRDGMRLAPVLGGLLILVSAGRLWPAVGLA